MTREELLKIAKPTLFSTEMVRAILDGRKTETRRIVKGVPNNAYRAEPVDVFEDGTIPLWDFLYGVPLVGGGRAELFETIKAPYKRGNYLYVHETWGRYPSGNYAYRADYIGAYGWKGWHPSIHMPKEAARIFLRVKDVRPEKLQDITKAGALAYGCDGRVSEPQDGALSDCQKEYDFSIEKFETVWDSTIKPKDRDKYGWAANPWVFVISFERIEPDE